MAIHAILTYSSKVADPLVLADAKARSAIIRWY